MTLVFLALAVLHKLMKIVLPIFLSPLLGLLSGVKPRLTLLALVIYTTIGDARVCVCMFAKLAQFLPVRSHFDTKHPVHFFHIATFPSPTFGPLFAFHCPLFFTKNNNLHAAMF